MTTACAYLSIANHGEAGTGATAAPLLLLTPPVEEEEEAAAGVERAWLRFVAVVCLDRAALVE